MTMFLISDMDKDYSSYDELSDREVELLSSSQPQHKEDEDTVSPDPDSMECSSSGSEFSPTLDDESSENSNSQVYIQLINHDFWCKTIYVHHS